MKNKIFTYRIISKNKNYAWQKHLLLTVVITTVTVDVCLAYCKLCVLTLVITLFLSEEGFRFKNAQYRSISRKHVAMYFSYQATNSLLMMYFVIGNLYIDINISDITLLILMT
jgi:hypothetical protein